MLLGALIFDWIRRVMNSAFNLDTARFTNVGSNSTLLGAIGGGLLLLGGTLLYWQKDQGVHEHSQGGNKRGIAQNNSSSGHVDDLSIAMDMREWPPASAVSEDASEREGQDNLGVVYRRRQRDAAVLNNPSQNVPREMEPHHDLAGQFDLAKDAAVVDGGLAKFRLAPMRLDLIKIRPGNLSIPERSPIKIDYEFQISRYEITQNQYTLITQSKDPSHFASASDTLPVENVSWLDAVRFCNELSDNHRLPSCYIISETDVSWIGGTSCPGYRLATEEEWLYAAHAGAPAAYSGSSEPAQVAWYFYNAEYRTHPVGLKMPNAWKLYDMSGNVSEWVWDHHKAEHRGASYFTANLSNTVRTFLGGSFHDIEKRLLLSHRQPGKPNYKGSFIGLRVVKTSLAH